MPGKCKGKGKGKSKSERQQQRQKKKQIPFGDDNRWEWGLVGEVEEGGEDVVGEQAAARGEGESLRGGLEQAVVDEGLGGGERWLEGGVAEGVAERVELDAGVAAQAEKPGLFELLNGAEPALLGDGWGRACGWVWGWVWGWFCRRS